MAIFVEGMRCQICGRLMLNTDNLKFYPPFIRNSRDKAHFFHDGVFHASCVRTHPDHLRADEILERTLDFRRSPKVCSLSGVKLTYDDAVATPYLTDDDALAAKKYNFLWFSKVSLKNDEVLDDLLLSFQELANAESWDPKDANDLALEFERIRIPKSVD